MQSFVFILFCGAARISCHDPASLYKQLRDHGDLNPSLSLKDYLQKTAEQDKLAEIQRSAHDVPVEVGMDVENNKIYNTHDDSDVVEAARRTNSIKFFEWFKNAFKGNKNVHKTDAVGALFGYLKKNQEVQTKIAKILTSLTESITTLNKYLEEHHNRGEILIRVPYYNITRVKRSSVRKPVPAYPKTVNVTKKVEVKNVTKAVEPAVDSENVEILNVGKNVDIDPPNGTKDADPANDAEKISVDENSREPCQLSNTRRNLNSAALYNEALEVKQKLLTYIEEYFQEVKDQISKLQEMKQVYSMDSSFRVGYIVANVDILQDNIIKLKQETAANYSSWSERQLIEVFDKLKASDKVLTGLMQTVRTIYSGDSKDKNLKKIPALGSSSIGDLVRKDTM